MIRKRFRSRLNLDLKINQRLKICNNSNCKSDIFSDTNIDFLKQNKDVVSEYTMHILSSGFFPLIFLASRNVNIQSFTILGHIITNDNTKDTNVFQNIQSILRPLF